MAAGKEHDVVIRLSELVAAAAAVPAGDERTALLEAVERLHAALEKVGYDLPPRP